MIDLRFAILLCAWAIPCPAPAAEPPNQAVHPKGLEQIELEQQRMLRDVRTRLESVEEGPKKEELKRLLAEIDRRLDEQGSGKIYLSPASRFTPEMSLYHTRLIRKIEDCGTRHLPIARGKTANGSGLISITIDKTGKLLASEVLESSQNRLIDRHIQRVMRSSSPFGPLPEQLTLDSSRTYRSAVIVTRFEFKSESTPVELLPDSEQCNWK